MVDNKLLEAVRASGEDNSPPPSESPKNSSPPPKASAPPPSSSPPPAPKEQEKSPPPPLSTSNSTTTGSPPPSKSSPSPPQENNSPPPTIPNSPPPIPNSPPPEKTNSSSSPPPSTEKNSPPPNENNPPPSSSSAVNSTKSPPSPLALSPAFRTPSENSNAPPKLLSPPKSSSKDDVTPVPESSQDGTKVAAIASVVVAGGLLILVFAVFVIVCTKKKNKKHGKHMYYGNQPRGGGYYPNNQQNWQNTNMSQDYNINLPLPPGGPNGFQPPPLLPIMSSGDMSSGLSGSHGSSIPPLHSSSTLGVNQSQFTYEELAAATSGFTQANLLGQGGFGFVHKGVLPNGKEVAVKSLKAGSGQGDREFRAEVEIINRVHHRHLVSLVGFCILNEQKMLVYEFVPNNTLEYHLHGRDHPTLDWPSRLKIALGSAKGLAYLHEDCHPRIIHRDIKASNILIDEAFEAKVADFGLAKLTGDNFTHVSTRVMGTFGYMAPEYASSGKLTEKSDVFSFGVMLLELITGRRPVDHSGNMEDSLVDWARPLCQRAVEEGNYEELVDPCLEGNYVPHEMACMVACAGASIRHSARRRPKMSQVVRALEGDVSLDDLNEGTKPGQSGIHGSSGSSEYNASSYSEDMKKFRKMALGSQEYGGSSDYGATSEYGLNPSTSSSDSDATKNNSRKI